MMKIIDKLLALFLKFLDESKKQRLENDLQEIHDDPVDYITKHRVRNNERNTD